MIDGESQDVIEDRNELLLLHDCELRTTNESIEIHLIGTTALMVFSVDPQAHSMVSIRSSNDTPLSFFASTTFFRIFVTQCKGHFKDSIATATQSRGARWVF